MYSKHVHLREDDRRTNGHAHKRSTVRLVEIYAPFRSAVSRQALISARVSHFTQLRIIQNRISGLPRDPALRSSVSQWDYAWKEDTAEHSQVNELVPQECSVSCTSSTT